MSRQILLGDEAIALGAVHAGLSAGYSYPGTPASEIMEYLIRLAGETKAFTAVWSVNEKVAYEEALGASFAGKRALVSFKHVGLNVAADPFMNSAVTGANGGLLVVSADDPGMHSSQNEQDSRYYVQFAQIFAYEPSDHQEAYDMAREAFDVSERFGLPVLMRLVTRLAHSRSPVEIREPRGPNELRTGAAKDWTLLPVNARRRFALLLDRQPEMVRFSEESPFNVLKLNASDRSLGVIASGVGYNYFREAMKGEAALPSFLKVSTYPLPEGLIRKLVGHVDAVLVVEDGYPFIERQLKGFFGIAGKTVLGKLSGVFPVTGELSPDNVRRALGRDPLPAVAASVLPLSGRPPQLCVGCSHADTFKALNKALENYSGSNVFSDIGCYTLGALPPYNAVQTGVCMGASVSMARGASDVGLHPAVSVIGDSTFAHSGITPLLGAAHADTNMTVIVLDNATTAMTGGQPSYGTGERLLRIIEGVGVPKEHIRTIEPLPKNHEKNIQVIKEEIEHRGLSVIVAVRECVQEQRKKRS
ncbi:MAG: indolepyruvate ferredoxin oxidoreductase [Candidatus Aminicenantes bacterium RBG_13_64_14]|nr:MAG: indolepyruvate ferredoxin oxidoreductase [Candidatus Aminicenantes bacterium RBG_13_64_14]